MLFAKDERQSSKNEGVNDYVFYQFKVVYDDNTASRVTNISSISLLPMSNGGINLRVDGCGALIINPRLKHSAAIILLLASGKSKASNKPFPLIE